MEYQVIGYCKTRGIGYVSEYYKSRENAIAHARECRADEEDSAVSYRVEASENGRVLCTIDETKA